MAKFKPFENDEQSWSAGAGDGLTINNGTQTLSIYGEIKFAMADNGGDSAKELLSILRDASGSLVPGDSPVALWVKIRGPSVVVGGDVDLQKGKTPAGALAKAIAALDKLTSVPAPDMRGPKA